jgi:hypothetical protein
MKMQIARLIQCCAVGLLAFCGSAQALTFTVTYTGTIESSDSIPGIDSLGLFGPAGGSLVGRDYTAVYRWDTTTSPTRNVDDGDVKSLVGGSGVPPNTASPSLGALLTINNIAIPIPGTYYGETTAFDLGGIDGVGRLDMVKASPLTSMNNYIDATPSGIPFSLTTPFTYDVVGSSGVILVLIILLLV